MKLPLYQIDAFASSPFTGNPAAVCPLDKWLPDELMQNIAAENNLSETVFIVPEEGGFHIRWFTPIVEVNLCGHATLAAAYVIFKHLNYPGNAIAFSSRSGRLSVERNGDLLLLDFPISPINLCPTPKQISEAFGVKINEVFIGEDYMVVLENQRAIEELQPDYSLLATLNSRGVIATAKGDDVDFVSRWFGPQVGVNEDPVTGSAHCQLIPYWADILGKKQLVARQLSRRGGELLCTLHGDRVIIAGRAVEYLAGEISV